MRIDCWSAAVFRLLKQACLGACLFAGLSAAAQAACAGHVQHQRNRDGSQIQLTQTSCSEEGETSTLALALKPRGARDFHTVLTQADLGEDWRSASLRDVEGGGHWALEVRGPCGAGPNCEGLIYKPGADSRGVYLFFEGGYSEFLKIPGYYVESGRASCCSWEYHLYKPSAPGEPIAERNFRYRLVVDGTASKPADECVLTDVRTQRRVPIRDRHIRKLCAVYDQASR